MCLKTEALALFLSIISPEIVSTAPNRITVHATVQDVIWRREADDDIWCTDQKAAIGL